MLYSRPRPHLRALRRAPRAPLRARRHRARQRRPAASPSLSDEAKSLVHDLRGTTPPGGLTYQVSGTTAGVLDFVEGLYRDFPLALLIVVVATYVILLILLRSVMLPLKAIAMNALSLLASYGALVWVFQDGNFAGLLGFTPLGFVEASLPIIMFCILFGVSMDYEVFLLSRIRETWLETGDNTRSVATGLERSGRIITSAALIVVVVAGSFVTAEIVLVKALGLGVALAVLLDATIVRALLVPATMRLLGDWNWWLPGRLQRLLPDVDETMTNDELRLTNGRSGSRAWRERPPQRCWRPRPHRQQRPPRQEGHPLMVHRLPAIWHRLLLITRYSLLVTPCSSPPVAPPPPPPAARPPGPAPSPRRTPRRPSRRR